MNYNPAITDRSADILADANARASAIQFAGMQSFGQSIGQGLAGLGGSIGKRLEQKQEDAAKAASIGEALNTMQAILPTYGSEGVALQEIITNRVSEAGNNLDKMSGILMAFQPAVQNLQSRVNQAALIEGYKDLADYKSSLGGSSTDTAATPKYDFNYATQFNKALYDSGITDPEQQKQKFNEAGIGHLYEKFINPPKQNMGFFGPVTQ